MKKARKDGSIACILVDKSRMFLGQGDPNIFDLYLQCSVQDYFIKFCESDVKEEDIRHLIDKAVNAKFEIIKGDLDDCPDEFGNKRTGYYARLNKIN